MRKKNRRTRVELSKIGGNDATENRGNADGLCRIMALRGGAGVDVSAEVYLAANLLFDFFLLCLSARGTWFFRPERLASAALVGALSALVFEALMLPAAAFAAVIPVCLIAFPLTDGRRFLAASARVLLYAFLLAGAMDAVRRAGAARGVQVLTGMGAVWAADALGRQIRPEQDRVQLRVWSGGRWRRFAALVDTGNLLREPLSALPVLIADEAALGRQAYRTLSAQAGLRTAGFQTVGGEGELLCVRPERIEVRAGEHWRQAPDLWIGLYPGRLRGNVHALAPGVLGQKRA